LYFKEKYNEYGRCSLSKNTIVQHVPNKSQGHQTRVAGAKVFVCQRISLPAAPKESAGQARHSSSEIQNSNFCKWMLLARTPKLQIFCFAQNKNPVVAAKNYQHPKTRSESQSRTPHLGLAHNYHLGV